jgi:hypothetical protein
MNSKELEAKVKMLEDKVRTLEDIEEIKSLQRIYGYYLDNDMQDDIIGLFSDYTESVEIADRGVFLGKEGVRKMFKGILGKEGKAIPPELTLHLVMQHQGVVHVAEDGKTAKGRWQGWMVGTKPVAGVNRQTWGHGIYENEYVKENGTWKFKKLYFNLTFQTPYEDGWLKTPVVSRVPDPIKPDRPSTAYHPYPSGYRVPCHWKQPVAGRQNAGIGKKGKK